MISARRRAKAVKAQSMRAKAQPRHKDGRFKRQRDPAVTLRKPQKFRDNWDGKDVGYKIATKPMEFGGKTYDIPVDEKGHVPDQVLVMRFGQYTDGSRDGRNRSVTRDLNKTSEKRIVLNDDVKPEDIIAWWAHPNEMDIVGIDDENSVAYSTEGATRKSSLRYQKRIGISGTRQEREMIRKTLDATFTAKELDKMTKPGGTYSVVHTGRKDMDLSTAGYYNSATKDIVLRKGAGPGTVIHESVHKLKHADTSRKGQHTSSKIDEVSSGKGPAEIDRLRAQEEASTEAETIGRLSPFKSNGKRMSYYGEVAKSEEEARRFIAEDRKRIVGNADPDGRGLRGNAVVNRVEKEFVNTHISKYSKKRT